MKRSWKIFFTFLAFSVFPLLVYIGIVRHQMRRLESFLPDLIHENIQELISDNLLYSAVNSARAFRLKLGEMESILKIAVSQVESALSHIQALNQNASGAAHFWGLDSADALLKRLQSIGILPYQWELLIAGQTAVLSKGEDHPAEQALELPSWYGPTIKGGTLVRSFDSRLTDSESQRATVSIHLKLSQSSTDAALGLSIRLTDLMEVAESHSVWSQDLFAFVVKPFPASEKKSAKLLGLAGTTIDQDNRLWEDRFPPDSIHSSDRAQFDALVNRMAKQKFDRGYMMAPYQGSAAIWAYAHLTDDLNILCILPSKIILDLPQAMTRIIQRFQKKHQRYQWAAVGVLVVLTTFVAYWRSRTATSTLRMLINGWSRLAQGDFSVRLPVGTGDERDKLIQAFNTTVPQIQEQIRIQKDLQVAHEVQAALLPAKPVAIPGIDLAGASIYCDETGGDYYDLIFYDPDRPHIFTVAIGDVSGHGIGSALVMATARGLLKALSDNPGNLSDRMIRLNRLLAEDLSDSGQFMTLFLVEVDAQKQVLRWVRAGHDPAYLYDPETHSIRELGGRGMALGVDENEQYEENQTSFDRSNQILLLGTDGIWEARNTKNEMFGKKRLQSLIRNHARQSAEVLKTLIFKEVSHFCQGEKQEDDITLLVVKKL
jgi:sigma-B regulation protein RsbU (phosphoserine phosphatase)